MRREMADLADVGLSLMMGQWFRVYLRIDCGKVYGGRAWRIALVVSSMDYGVIDLR